MRWCSHDYRRCTPAMGRSFLASSVGGAVVNTREQILHDWEISDPPTADEIRLYLKDPEIDWTPAEMVESIRRIATRIMGTHRGCAGCTTCTEHGVLNTAADSFEVALAIIQSFLSVSPATAWDEGFNAAEEDIMAHDRNEWENDCIPNPYRSPATTKGNTDA